MKEIHLNSLIGEIKASSIIKQLIQSIKSPSTGFSAKQDINGKINSINYMCMMIGWLETKE